MSGFEHSLILVPRQRDGTAAKTAIASLVPDCWVKLVAGTEESLG